MEEAVFSDAWSESALSLHLDGAYSQTYLLSLDGETVGYLLSGGVPPESELYRIAVLPSARRAGGAKMLLSRYLADRRATGDTDFFLEVREKNGAARALYEAFGYTAVGVRKGYYKNPTEDACIYSLFAR
jgi:ribosomal-protein-alanine N-acetyltransferase